MKSNESATKEKTRKTAFFNIPRDWAQYLVGYEFEAVNKDGMPKLTKGKQPVRRQIDYLDLMLLDEIHSFAKRKKRDCFVKADTLADSVGMLGQEREICERVLQFCSLRIVIPTWKQIERNVYLVLKVDEERIKELILSRKECILSELFNLQKSPDFSREKYTFKDYLQEYIQEELQEELQEDTQEDGQEDKQKGIPEKVLCASPEPKIRRAIRKQ